MPHVSKFEYNGERIPSVNEVTGSLSQDGLIRNFYRPNGFKKADKISNEAREQGIKLAEVFERYRQTGKTGRVSVYSTECVKNWTDWFNGTAFTIAADHWVEPHLVNTKDGYHGSPDVILHAADGLPVLGDDKSKKRFADYKLIMNEHAYAMCDAYEDPETKEIKPLPWTAPMSTFWFWTYHPITGTLYAVQHEFKPEVYQDFLTCKAMWAVNKRAEKYFGSYAVLLPEDDVEPATLVRH